jgi:hypothetical protein
MIVKEDGDHPEANEQSGAEYENTIAFCVKDAKNRGI